MVKINRKQKEEIDIENDLYNWAKENLMDGSLNIYRKPYIFPDTCFLIKYEKCWRKEKENGINWKNLALLYTYRLAEELSDHKRVCYSNGDSEISPELYERIIKHGAPTNVKFDSSEDELLEKHGPDIDKAIKNSRELTVEEVSDTDRSIIASAMEAEPRPVLIFSEDSHIKETVKELKEKGFRGYNSGYNNIGVLSCSDIVEILEKKR